MGTPGSATLVQGANSESQDAADYCFAWSCCLHHEHARARVWLPWLPPPSTMCEGARDHQGERLQAGPREDLCHRDCQDWGEDHRVREGRLQRDRSVCPWVWISWLPWQEICRSRAWLRTRLYQGQEGSVQVSSC